MLKEYRIRAKLFQEELEKITNVDRKTIFRVENDYNVPLLDTFAKLVIALKMSNDEIAQEVKKITKNNTKS